MSKQLVNLKLAPDYMAYLSPIVTDVSLFEYCRTSTLVSEPDELTCLGLWKNYLPTRFEAYEKD